MYPKYKNLSVLSRLNSRKNFLPSRETKIRSHHRQKNVDFFLEIIYFSPKDKVSESFR